MNKILGNAIIPLLGVPQNTCNTDDAFKQSFGARMSCVFNDIGRRDVIAVSMTGLHGLLDLPYCVLSSPIS